LDGLANELFESIRRIVGAEMHQLGPLRLESNLSEHSPYGENANLRAVVALRQTTVTLRACDHTQAATAGLEGVEEVLRVHLAAARDFANDNVGSILRPLPRQVTAVGNAVAADVY